MRDYGRIDVRLSTAGIPFVVDVNPNCDLSRHAGMARAAAAVGIDYPSLAKLLVRYALRRRRAAATGVPLVRRSAIRNREESLTASSRGVPHL
jgi:D-alanine-D-alanine ligase